MQNIKVVKPYVKLLYKTYGFKLILIFLLGLLNSIAQGVGIVMIIPMLQAYLGKGEDKMSSILNNLGWDGSLEILLLFYFFVLISFGLLKSAYTYFSQRLTSKFGNDFTINSISKIINANWKFYIDNPPSRLVNLFKTEGRSISTLTLIGFRWVQSASLIFIQLLLAVIISPLITISTFILLLLMFLIQKVVFRTNFKIGNSKIKMHESLQTFLSETFSGIKLFKLHKLEDIRVDQYQNNIQDIFENDMKKARTEAGSELLYILSGSLIIVSVIYFSLNYNLLSIGSLLVLLLLLSRVIGQTKSIVQMTSTINNLLPSFNRFTELILAAEKYSDSDNKIQKPINVDTLNLIDVDFKYVDNFVIKNFSYEFKKGNFYLFFGPSGAGKTTMLDLISGLIKPLKGTVLINNQPESIQNNFSYALQDSLLFEGTIKDNITFYKDYSSQELVNVINESGLDNLINTLPNGIDTFITEGGKGLSGGEKQRIALARCLIKNTSIILLDEITSSLDRRNEQLIIETIQRIKKDKIVILVSHKDNLKDIADEVVMFSR